MIATNSHVPTLPFGAIHHARRLPVWKRYTSHIAAALDSEFARLGIGDAHDASSVQELDSNAQSREHFEIGRQ